MSSISNNLIKHSINDVARLLKDGSLTASHLVRDSLKIIEDNKFLNGFISVCGEDAIQTAEQVNDKQLGLPLKGIPISIKDNICTKGLLTTCASKMLHNFIPSYDAHIVTKLKESGAIIVGKTNLDEFAMGSSSTTSYFAPTANPYMSFKNCDKTSTPQPGYENRELWYMAGGSSTGSAVSVATGSCFASIGTDTGGSTRQPSSLVGVVGFKPTYGLVSRFGLIPLVHSLDVVSIISRTVNDTKIVFDVISGEDENDLTSVDKEKYLKPLTSGMNDKLRFGVPKNFIEKGNIDRDVAEVFEATLGDLQKLTMPNIELISIDLDYSRLASECYTILASCEISSNMSCYDGIRYGFHVPHHDGDQKFDREEFYKANRDGGFGDEVKKRILLGNYFLLKENREKYYEQSLKLRRLIHDEFSRMFAKHQLDIIVTPSTPTTSINYQAWIDKQNVNELFYEDYFLIPCNLANLPAISLPNGLSQNKLPVGIQLIANKYHDIDLLNLSEMLELRIFKSKMM